MLCLACTFELCETRSASLDTRALTKRPLPGLDAPWWVFHAILGFHVVLLITHSLCCQGSRARLVFRYVRKRGVVFLNVYPGTFNFAIVTRNPPTTHAPP